MAKLKDRIFLACRLVALTVATISVPHLTHADILSLEDAIKRATIHSPDIQVLVAQKKSAGLKAAQALAPTEPTIALTLQDMNTPVHGINGQASRAFTFTQPFAFPGKAFLAQSALEYQAKAVGAQLRAMELTISTSVRTAFYQLAIARENLRLNAEQRLFYERILAIAKRRYEAGAITQVDLLNAEIALHANDNDTSDLHSVEHTAAIQLNTIMGQPSEEALDLGRLKFDRKPAVEFSKLEDRMLGGRQELKVALFQEQASEKTFHLALMSWLPDFQVSAGTTFYDIETASPINASPGGGAHSYFVGLQMTLPIWFVFDQRLTMKGAASDLRSATANSHVLLQQSRLALETAVDSFKTSETKIANFEAHILPLTEQSLNLAIINYGAGKIDFQTLADTATARRVNRQNYLSTVTAYYNAYTTIGQLIGEDL